MTVLKAAFYTDSEDGPTEIRLTWYKQLPGVFNAPPGYVVSMHTPDYDGVMFTHQNHDTALSYAARTYRRMERKANEAVSKQHNP